MPISKNVHQLKVFDRVRLTKVLRNLDSSWMPEENLPIGLQGTVIDITENNESLYIYMNWDNGSGLALLESDSECYEKIPDRTL